MLCLPLCPRIGQANVDQAMRHQYKIGWFGLLTGRASIYWTYAQRDFHQKMKIDKPARRWTTQVLQQLFRIAWDLWKDRNNIKHSTATAAKKRESLQLDNEISELRSGGVHGITGSDMQHLQLSVWRQSKMTVEQK